MSEVAQKTIEQPTQQNFQCPNCGSGEIQRFSVIYQAGSSNINTTTAAVGMFGLGRSFGGGAAKTTGTSRTQLSQSVAPPARRGYLRWIGLGILLMFLVAMLTASWSMPDVVVNILSLSVGLGLMVWQCYASFRFNRDVYPQLMDKWHRSYLCNRCGSRFVL